jgi:DNA primase
MKTAETMLCKKANQVDLVNYLKKLGHEPQKIRGNDYWYLSPLRQEKTASFKVNRKLNIWYDHGTGKGGTLVDFGIVYFNCSVKELLSKLRDEIGMNVSFQAHRFLPAVEEKVITENSSKIKIIGANEISNPGLINYLNQRCIPLSIAKEYCLEISF